MRLPSQLSLAALVLASVTAAHAAEADVGLTASAIDIPDGFASVTQANSHQEYDPPVASVTVGATSGSSTSLGEADVDALSGIAHMSLSASTPVPEFGPQPGRSAAVGGGLSLTGSITLSPGVAPGMATFGGILEAVYNGGGDAIPFANFINGTYEFLVGSTSLGGPISYIGGDAGNLSIPLSVTMPVFASEVIDFDLELFMNVESTYGSTIFDASNTFKITTIDLPPGYSYTSDANGFLSELNPPVPEPANWALSMLGLVVVASVLKRRQVANAD